MIHTAKRALAILADTLAAIGERMVLSSLTISAAGMSVTVTPKPEPAPTCPTCGRPK